jgi:hypothetical protein
MPLGDIFEMRGQYNNRGTELKNLYPVFVVAINFTIFLIWKDCFNRIYLMHSAIDASRYDRIKYDHLLPCCRKNCLDKDEKNVTTAKQG